MTNITKSIKPTLFILVLIALAIAVAGMVKFNLVGDDIYVTQKDGSVMREVDLEEYVLTTETGETAIFTYTTKDKNSATLDIGNEFYQLKRAISASGAKYTNEDESVVYWEHQSEATVELPDGTTHNINRIEKADILTFNIDAHKQDCVGVSLMKCLVVNGQLFYDTISGFEFEEGTEYTISVARTQRENVPADASSYAYRLVEVVQSKKQGDPSANKYDFGNDSDLDLTEEDDIVETDKDLLPQIKLTANSWIWKETKYTNGDIVEAVDSSKFVVSFEENGNFQSTTDCNNVFGSYSLQDQNITFGPLASTRKACLEETQEMEYVGMLSAVVDYNTTESGTLLLGLKDGSGVMVFATER